MKTVTDFTKEIEQYEKDIKDLKIKEGVFIVKDRGCNMKVFQADQSELKRINAYFEQHGINTVFDADFELLKMYMSHPEKEITSHVMEALKKGKIIISDDTYILVKWAKDILATDILIRRLKNGYKLISVYPGCVESNRNEGGIFYPEEEEIGDNTCMSVGANPLDFLDPNIAFEKESFADCLDEPMFCKYAFALAAEVNNALPFEGKKLSHSYVDFDFINDEVCPVHIIEASLNDLVEFKHLGKKFYMFKWDYSDGFDEPVPVFIPASILPRGTKLYKNDVISLQIILFGHEAVYINPDEPDLERMKFDLITSLSCKGVEARD